MQHLGAAAKDAATHCPHASLLGGGVCVVPKEDEKAALAAKIKLYCKDYVTTCAGNSMAYADVADCIARATKFPVGEKDATAGNSLTCRVYHLGVAKTADPKKHCPHASLYGGNVCADERGKRQFQFCASYKTECKNDGTAYKNCLGVVDAMGRGNVDDPHGPFEFYYAAFTCLPLLRFVPYLASFTSKVCSSMHNQYCVTHLCGVKTDKVGLNMGEQGRRYV